jgi:hypothetical protein
MIIQGSPEWHQLRLGKATGSNISKIRAKIKTGWGASRAEYKTQLVLERITGKPTEFFVTGPMKDGTEREPVARSLYCQLFNREVIEVPFVDHSLIEMSGSSPDGLIVGENAGIEIKCQQPKGHLEVLKGAPIPDAHMQQMQWLMACSGMDFVDYINFNPDFPEHLQLKVRTVVRDPALISEMEDDVSLFLEEVLADENFLRELAPKERNAA